MTSLARQPLPLKARSSSYFRDYRLDTAFQPIFSLSHRRIVGFEALVRGHGQANEPIAPIELFRSASTYESALALDRLCQKIHIENFAGNAPDDRWLFLNLDTATLNKQCYLDGYIADVMNAVALPFHRLVIEVLENASVDEKSLFDAVAYFRSLGALVALDDFGAGHSNFDRIWRLAPDIIKLDRSIITQASQHTTGNLRRMLPNLIDLMHEAGSLVLVEGVETQEHAAIALDADADFLQGFYLAHPAQEIADESKGAFKLELVTDAFAKSLSGRHTEDRRSLSPYVKAFRAVRHKFKPGAALEAACEPLLAMDGVLRCGLLNENGEYLAQYHPPAPGARSDQRFDPVADSTGGTWFRRQYFRDAINEPQRVQVSRPYLSSTHGCMCVMLSVSNTAQPRRVFCCKIEWRR